MICHNITDLSVERDENETVPLQWNKDPVIISVPAVFLHTRNKEWKNIITHSHISTVTQQTRACSDGRVV